VRKRSPAALDDLFDSYVEAEAFAERVAQAESNAAGWQMEAPYDCEVIKHGDETALSEDERNRAEFAGAALPNGDTVDDIYPDLHKLLQATNLFAGARVFVFGYYTPVDQKDINVLVAVS
jgi:hypothetical protein